MKITYYIAPLVLAGALTACDRDDRAESLEETNTGDTTTEQRETTEMRNQTAQADTGNRTGTGGGGAGTGSGDGSGGAGVGSDTDTREGLYNTPEERGVNDEEDLRDGDNEDGDERTREQDREREEDRDSEDSRY